MIVPLLAALLLSSPVRAAQIDVPCAQDDQSRDWQATVFALTFTKANIPDGSPRAGTLKFKKCVHVTEISGEPITPRDERWFVSDDGSIGVIATVEENQPGAVWLTLVTSNGRSGLTNSAQLGSWWQHKVFYKGLGWDNVSVQDWRAGGDTIVTNVFLIPEHPAARP